MNQEKNKITCLCAEIAKNLLSLYPASELEDTLFDVFEEANLYADFTYEEKEKRKLLHEALRSLFRRINQNNALKETS